MAAGTWLHSIKRACDAAMVLLLPLLCAYSAVGEMAHEVTGLAIFLLFLLHHALNRGFVKALFRGRYTPARIYLTGLDVLMFVLMLAAPISGVLMSKHVLTGVSLSTGTNALRRVHMLAGSWLPVVSGLHLGAHLRFRDPRALIPFGLLSAYGAYAFVKRELWGMLTLRTMFVSFDDSAVLYFIDYLAVIALCALAGYGLFHLAAHKK